MKKSQYFEAGITVYPTVTRMKLTEEYLLNSNQRISTACYVENEDKFYHYQNGEFIELKVVAEK